MVGCKGACNLGVLVQVLFWGCACVFLHLDGRVHGGMQFRVLVLVVFWDAVWGAA